MLFANWLSQNSSAQGENVFFCNPTGEDLGGAKVSNNESLIVWMSLRNVPSMALCVIWENSTPLSD